MVGGSWEGPWRVPAGGRRPRARSVSVALVLIGVTVAVLTLVVTSTPTTASTPGVVSRSLAVGAPHAATPAPSPAASAGFSVPPTVPAPAGSSLPPLALQIASGPSTICAGGNNSCSAGTGVARVTLTATAAQAATPFWPNVQVAFVVETTAYDGDFDHYNSFYGQDPCAAATSGQGPLCEESNGVPFFVANAGLIASSIQAANPHSNVSFALVDFFGTDCGDWNDCGDSYMYHVDIPDFVGPSAFGPAVRSTFQAQILGGGYTGIFGLDDNFLHSPVITALYGAITGSGLTWSANTHHVIVWIGSTAPRDPSYAENYWVSPFDHCCSGSQRDGWTCEPSYTFANGASPNCEGWIRSQDGNPNDSIAALAHTAHQCTESVGQVCTIDVVDLWDTPTDPLSPAWIQDPGYPSGTAGAGPGGTGPTQDSEHIILAGCDMARATGGTWDGPAFWTCPDGQAGSLQYVPHGGLQDPNTNNPTLFNALRGIGFGPEYRTLVANGTGQPMFTFVPEGAIRVAPDPQFAAACVTPGGFLPTCQRTPTVLHAFGLTYLGWNWSTNASNNALYVGDQWTASFDVIDTAPPYGLIPIDSCQSPGCFAGHSTPVNGLYTWAMYRPASNVSVAIQSFPLAQVIVVQVASPGPPPETPAPPPPVPPDIPILAAPPIPTVVPTPTLNVLGVTNVSIQATAAGFLGAGFMRVGLKNRPVAMKIAALSKNAGSKFDAASSKDAPPGIGRFE